MGAKRKARRQLTAAEKLKILEEARQPQTTVAEVLRRHQLDATTFYRWEREAKAVERERVRATALEAKLARKDAVIAEF